MSDEGEVFFNINHGGQFETHLDGEITYEGGSLSVIQTAAKFLFTRMVTELNLSVHGNRIWYKLPFEGLKELKILYSGSVNFDKMREAINWTRLIDIYIVNDSEEDASVPKGSNHGVENDDGRNVDTNVDDVECEEEARIEKLVAGLEDDDSNDDYQATPHASDCEDEAMGTTYERWKRGSGELKIRQVFESIKEFKEAVLEYALKGGWNIQFTKWGGVKSQAKCGAQEIECPCPWKIYCSYEESAGQWMVKTFQDVHTCFKDGHCKILSDTKIARLFVDDVRNDPLLKPRVIQEQILERYNLGASYDQCRKAKKKALDIIQEEHDEQYRRIKDYELEILRSNKNSTTELRTTFKEGGLEVFDRFYVCFAALKETWLSCCRPIFGIDGCFLKGNTKGQLLTAVGRDANNQIFPIAWAVVHVENTNTWLWFIQNLKKDLKLENGNGFTLVSDQQKGLLIAVEQELSLVEHRMCARHIYGNLKKLYPKKSQMKSLFWEIVESHNMADHERNLASMRKYDEGLYEALMSKNPSNFCRAFFKTTSTCEDALNNFSESYNSAIEKARSLPLIEMLETIRRQTMIRIEIRKQKTRKHQGKFSLKVAKVIAAEEKERKWCSTIPGPTGLFEVLEKGMSHKVNMKEKTCSCRRWDLTGIPCRHALRVVFDKKTYNIDALVSDWYLTSKWQEQYMNSINPLNGLKFWHKSGEATIDAPPRVTKKGRKRNPQKRIKGINESPTKGKKVTGHCRTMHCYRCGFPGHNSTKCANSGVPFKPRPPKKAKKFSKDVEQTQGTQESQKNSNNSTFLSFCFSFS